MNTDNINNKIKDITQILKHHIKKSYNSIRKHVTKQRLRWAELRHKSLSAKLAKMSDNKHVEIRKRMGKYKNIQESKISKIHKKYERKIDREINIAITRIKATYFTNSNNLETEVKNSEKVLKHCENDLRTHLNQLETLKSKLRMRVNEPDYTLPSSEYNSLVQQRYILQGKLNEAGSNPHSRLPKSNYYALVNKIAQIDNQIKRAQQSRNNKSQAQIIKSEINDMEKGTPHLKKKTESAKDHLFKTKQDYERALDLDNRTWDNKKYEIHNQITKEKVSLYQTHKDADLATVNDKYDALIAKVPEQVQAEIDAVHKKVTAFESKIERLKNHHANLSNGT